MAQLAHWSLPKTEVCGSNPVIDHIFSIISVEKNWKKRPLMFPLLQENNRKYLMYFGQISLLEEMLFKRKCPRNQHN